MELAPKRVNEIFVSSTHPGTLEIVAMTLRHAFFYHFFVEATSSSRFPGCANETKSHQLFLELVPLITNHEMAPSGLVFPN